MLENDISLWIARPMVHRWDMDYLSGFERGGIHTCAVLLTSQRLALGQAQASDLHNIMAESVAWTGLFLDTASAAIHGAEILHDLAA